MPKRFCATASNRTPLPKTSFQGASSFIATSSRPTDSARTGSESGPSSTVRPGPPYSRSASHGTTGGVPDRAPSCAADVMRHSRAQPARSWASSTNRSGGSTTCAPPRAGVRGRCTGGGGARASTARSMPKSGRTPAPAHACANRTAPVTVSRSVSARADIPRSAARSTSCSGWEAP